MAVSDRNIEMLVNSLQDLMRTMKNDKNSFGSQDTGIRLGRGGSANARAVRDANEGLERLGDNLQALHKSMTSGGSTLADHFKQMVKNLKPLTVAFDKLEEVVKEAVATQSKAYGMAAQKTFEYVKKVNGNVKKLQELNDEYGELVATANEIVDNQESYAKDQNIMNKKLAKLSAHRAKIEAEFGKGVINGPLALFFKNLEKGKLDAKLSDNARTGLNSLNDQFKAVHNVSGSFLKDMTASLKTAQAEFSTAVGNLNKAVGSALVKEVEKIPGFISSRLRFGFESNQFMDAFRMGMSSQELNEFRSANRDVLAALSGFGKNVDIASTESLRQWSDNAKRVGLIGKDAADFTSQMLRNAYNTGRTFNETFNQEMISQAQLVQQAFGGSIQDASRAIQDYSSQVYNLARFNKQATAEEQAALQKELTTRMLHTKYMGYEIEYMKQQELMRHNQSFADIGDRIRQGILTQVGTQVVSKDAGLTKAEQDALTAQQLGGGSNLTDQQLKDIQSAQMKLAQWKTRNESNNAAAFRQGGIQGGIQAMLPQYAGEALLQRGGTNLQQITDAETAAAAQRRARGDISFEDYLSTMKKNAQDQQDSVTTFDLAVQEFSESVAGLSGLPGAAIVGAIAGMLPNIIGALIKRSLITSAAGAILGGGGGGAAAGGLSAGAAGAGAAGAGGLTAAGVATGAAGVGLAAAAGAGLGYLGYKGGSAAYYSDSKLAKGAALSNPLTALGYGATAVSDYFSNRNGDSAMSISDRVAKTGTFTEADVEEMVRLRQVGSLNGTWFGDSKEEAADREAVVAQLTQLASFRRKRNSAPADRSLGAGISMSADQMNGITRDAAGNPVTASGKSIQEEMLEVQKKQLALQEEELQVGKEREDRREAVAARQVSVREYQANLADTMVSKFNVTA